jgi:phosphoribosylformimino-5-aminoimidazole carboxamide ribotide isomerase
MKIIPAIDLIQRKVVRLTKGDPNQATFYDSMGTPVEIAKKWQAQGAKRLHIIDLDAAFGKPDNLQTALEILQATKLPIQVGGGIRSVAAVERLLDAGIQHVILGSLALREPSTVTQLQKKFGADRIIVALDHRDGRVMIEGWTSGTEFTLTDALEMYIKLGAKAFLITSITKDGTLSGLIWIRWRRACNFPGLKLLRQAALAAKRFGCAQTDVRRGKALVVGKALLKGASH